ncbi:MAG TPA: hypothetical protein VLB44_14695 [Kofleriaceae bacterium]|nr:hypothetical protein [Kofleriaceae bacterium]
MTDTRPFLVVPASPRIDRTFDAALLERITADERARSSGVVIIMPTGVMPNALMGAAHLWPFTLRGTGVSRIAVVLGVASYSLAEPILRACVHRMAEQHISVTYFHEGHLESDQVRAWCEMRPARRRVTTDSLVKLGERYAERGDVSTLMHAISLAERGALRDEHDGELAERVDKRTGPQAIGRTVRIRGGAVAGEQAAGRQTADLDDDASVARAWRGEQTDAGCAA